jgi:hypothetical protein
MFTDRFIKVPVAVYDVKEKELTNKATYEDSYTKFNPFDISEYRPTYDSDNREEECTVITLKDGNSIMAYLTIEEFEKLLNNNSK